MVEWTVVEIPKKFDFYVRINNTGRFYFNKRILELCKRCSYTYIMPLITSDKKCVGFKFSIKYELGFYGLKFTGDHCVYYRKDLAKICLNGNRSKVFQLFYDEVENVWFIKINS